MFKTEAKVQAVLAFGGPLKPVARQDPKPKKHDEVLAAEAGKKDAKRKDTDVKYGSPSKFTKRKRQANGVNPNEVGRTMEHHDLAKKRSIVEPHTKDDSKSLPNAVQSRRPVAAPQTGKNMLNPVFARAAKQREAPSVVTVDLTNSVSKVVVPSDRQKLRCQISRALPPVHILQGLDIACCANSGPKMQIRKGSNTVHNNQAQSHTPIVSGCLGPLLQIEDQDALNSLSRSELVAAGIASTATLIQCDKALPGKGADTNQGQRGHAVGACVDEQPQSAVPDSPQFYSYIHRLMQSLHHDRSSSCPAEDCIWGEHLDDLRERAQCAASELPWTHKYAPVAARRVLANADAAQELLMWLKQVEPIEAALTSMRSGQMTDSNAMSSWKADSDDSDFELGCARQAPGVGGMLISGPHGCGKSAAVYACAQELGVQVLEINPGMDRTGATLLKLIGEATQSHRVQWGPGGQADEVTGGQGKSKSARSLKKGISEARKASAKRIGKSRAQPSADQPVLPGASTIAPPLADDPPCCAHPAQRSLLLFEDFDQLLDQDEGFMASVATLLNKSKIAVILLSERPDAESVLRGATTCASIKSFRMQAPSHAAIVEYLGLVCACEERFVPPQMLHRLACTCHGDLRRALLQLQFIASQPPPGQLSHTQQITPAVMPVQLSHLHAPLLGAPTVPLDSAAGSPHATHCSSTAAGVADALLDCDWACAYLRLSTRSGATDKPASVECQSTESHHASGVTNAAIPSNSGQLRLDACAQRPEAALDQAAGAQCAAAEPGTQLASCHQADTEPSGAAQGTTAGEPGPAVWPAAPAWLHDIHMQHDVAAAAVLDSWAGVIQQRQKALQMQLSGGRKKRRATEACVHSPAGAGNQPTLAAADGAAPGLETQAAPRPAEDVSHLEDDVKINQGTPAGSSEEETMVKLLASGAAPTSEGCAPAEPPSAAANRVLDDSDVDADDAAAVPAAGDRCQTNSSDEAAVVAAVLDEMVMTCEQSQCLAARGDANEKAQDPPNGAACTVHAAATVEHRIAMQSCCAAGMRDEVVPVPIAGIAAAAAAAGMQAAAAALGGCADTSVAAAVPCVAATTPSEGGVTEKIVTALSRTTDVLQSAGPHRGRGRPRQGADGEPEAPERGRGRPRKNTTAQAAAAGASRASAVLQQAQENMLRYADRLQSQAAELRSRCGVDAQDDEAASGRSGKLGKENSMPVIDRGQEGAQELLTACTVADVVSAADVFGSHLAASCREAGGGVAGEWLWVEECGVEEGRLGNEAAALSGGCPAWHSSVTAERAEGVAGGVCGALWGCCGASAEAPETAPAAPDSTLERRARMVHALRLGARDCSRRSVFDTWHALGCMSHDECAAALAQDGSVPRRTRRKRGHCAEAVFVWDMEVDDIDAAVLTWQGV
eukprot:jgi/Ulvmu1/1600/UM111_0028.1